MKHDLILGCGIGRCGTGWLSFFMFLNPKIAVWDGPGMGEMFDHTIEKTDLPLSDLHDVWGDDYQEPTHAMKNGLGKWEGFDEFTEYYDRRILGRRQSEVYFVSHVFGEQWYSVYADHFECSPICVCCARKVISHYRSFKRWYHVDGITAEDFVGRLRGSMNYMDEIVGRGIPVVALNIPDYTVKTCAKKAAATMAKIGIAMSDEQKLFLKKRRKLGPSPVEINETDSQLLKELTAVPDFDDVLFRYDAFRRKYEA